MTSGRRAKVAGTRVIADGKFRPSGNIVHAILARFKKERDAKLAEVFVTIFQIFLFLNTFSRFQLDFFFQ